ncbi:hypothetical protein GCM10025867_23380 [Frondihabitans sucicola]|uniref:Uncharacterized protein n=1 Tax=Frondihabitans sucicola TaxID=1268041 RepID=A0ABM8GNS5_9MICO|nr:hypothetical protein [Frondihabitans sucicola]BDZ50097.1 hypothetical protein GCM10025867_23380 [Frondihabitans sucicola]
MTLWSTLVTVAVGAFLGSGAAFASNLLAGRIGDRRREAAALNELVHEIHFRRILRRVEPRLSPRADVLDPGYEKARHSASTLRGEIRRARRALVPRSGAQPDLDAMTLACNAFLDASEADPARYQLFLMQLQARLSAAVARVAARSTGVDDLEPGNAELAPTVPGLAVPTEIGEPRL